MRKIYTLFVVLLLTTGAFAQWSKQWSNVYNNTTTSGYANQGRKVAVDAAGNVFVISDVTSNLDAVGHPVATTQYYVVLQKYDFGGTLLVERLINVGNINASGFDYKSAFGLIVDASNNVYVGYSNYNNGNYDVQLTKYNNALVQTWSYRYTTPGNDFGVDMTVVSGAIYAAVKTVNGGNTTYSLVSASANGQSGVPFYSFDVNVDVVNALIYNGRNIYVTGSRLVSGATTVMTAAVAKNIFTGGALLWKATYNNNTVTGNDYGTGLVVGSDGSIYVAATVTAGSLDPVVLKYRDTGTLSGSLVLDQASTADVSAGIANGASGIIYLAASNTTRVSAYQLNLNTFRIVASAFVSPVPASTYTAVTNVKVNDMKISSTGGIYLTGAVSATSPTGNLTGSFAAKFGYNGLVFGKLHSQSVQGTNAYSYEGVSIALDPTHNNSIVWLRNGYGTNASHANQSVYLESYFSNTTLRTALTDESANVAMPMDVNVYPNPASEVLNISAASITKVELYDILGSLVRTAVGGDMSQMQLVVSDLNRGVYMCRITTNDNAISTKRIVIK